MNSLPAQSALVLPPTTQEDSPTTVRWLTQAIMALWKYNDRLRRGIELSFIRSDTVAWTPGTIADKASVTTTVTVRNASVKMTALASFDATMVAGIFLSAAVTASETVTVTMANLSGASVTVAAGNLRVDVFV